MDNIMETKTTGLEDIYRQDHETRRGQDFVVFGEERGTFLKKYIGVGKSVLDIGCRDGALTSYYAETNTVLGVDVDRVALKRAEEKLGIRTLHMDLNGDWSEIPKNTFDVVVAAEIIEHLYYPGLVLEKIAAVLKPDGILVGSIPHAFSFQNRLRLVLGSKAGTPLQDPTHINHFWWREFEQLLKKEFTVREIKPILSNKFDWLPGEMAMPFAHSLLFYAIKNAYE